MKRWDPESFLRPQIASSTTQRDLQTALVIINTPIVRLDVFETIWQNGPFCAAICFRSTSELKRLMVVN
jgi:hypothetical protein